MKVYNFGNDYMARIAKHIDEKIKAAEAENPITKVTESQDMAVKEIEEKLTKMYAGDKVHQGAEGDMEPEAQEGDEEVSEEAEPEAEGPKKDWKKNRKKGKR